MSFFLWAGLGVLGLLAVGASFAAWAWFSVDLPPEVKEEEVFFREGASWFPYTAASMPPLVAGLPKLKRGQKIKILSWNVQFMAGKNYVFFFDPWNGSGPDERPLRKDIEWTLNEVSRVIMDENPDFIFLQEVDEGAKRTDGEDQLQRLIDKLPPQYPFHTSTFYWKAGFVPHPRVLGSVGLKLSILSKYPISKSTRISLPRIPGNKIYQHFNLRRAVLEARVPVVALPGESAELALLNTHLDAFAQGTDTLKNQVHKIQARLNELTENRNPWVIGGDFNLLLPEMKEKLVPEEQRYFETETELQPLLDRFLSVPSLSEGSGANAEQWYTHLPNRLGGGSKPDRTIDYLFYSSGLRLGVHYVRGRDTLKISDHLPLVGEWVLTE